MDFFKNGVLRRILRDKRLIVDMHHAAGDGEDFFVLGEIFEKTEFRRAG